MSAGLSGLELDLVDDADHHRAHEGVGGAVSQRSTTVEGQSVIQSFAWTDLGQLSSVIYPQIAGIGSARTVSYGYTNGFLTSVPSYATSISYSVNTMPYQIAHANGVSATYGLDSNRIQRVAGVTTTGASTNNLNLTPFAYDGADNIKSIGSQTFVYDKVSRLTSATIVTGGTSKTQAASYDAFGFILSLNTNGTNQTFTPVSGTNHISGSNYDGAGNMTGWGVYTYTWDQLGKMRTVTGTGVNHTYLYTADGERISDRDSLATTTTLTVRGSDGKVLRIYSKSGSTWSWSKDYVYRGGLLLGSIDASATKYFDLDHLGTPRLITGSGGTTLAVHDYYPFGIEASSATQDAERMKFTGHERDLMGTSSQTDDLDYMHARYDNPNLARFLSPDLLRGDPHQPQSFNLFAYVQGNPVNFVDPLGLQFDLSYNAPKQRETGRVTITYGGFGEGIPIAIPSSVFWMIFGPGVLGGSQAGDSVGGGTAAVTLASYFGQGWGDWITRNTTVPGPWGSEYSAFTSTWYDPTTWNDIGAGLTGGWDYAFKASYIVAGVAAVSASAVMIAESAGVEINVLSDGNIFKIISKEGKWGFRIDPAHHGKPWGHRHWWKWGR